jgi:hypothetical protein
VQNIKANVKFHNSQMGEKVDTYDMGNTVEVSNFKTWPQGERELRGLLTQVFKDLDSSYEWFEGRVPANGNARATDVSRCGLWGARDMQMEMQGLLMFKDVCSGELLACKRNARATDV